MSRDIIRDYLSLEQLHEHIADITWALHKLRLEERERLRQARRRLEA